METRTGKSRHIEVKINCEYCGTEKWVKLIRYKKGQGRFCSTKCFGLSETLGKDKKYVGKKNGKTVFNKTGNRYVVYWFDEVDLKRHSTTYARWFWEMNHGEIPPGYRASYKDGNSLNISDDNIIIISPQEFGAVISEKGFGHHIASEETRKKQSIAHSGKVLSEEHRRNIGKATKEMWQKGTFDAPEIRDAYRKQGLSTRGSKRTAEQKRAISISHKKFYENPENRERRRNTCARGDKHPSWRGGVSKELYPLEFNKRLRRKILDRDNHTCKICGLVVSSYVSRVHHIDANKNNNSEENLITLCKVCHGKVHGQYPIDDPVILAFRSALYKDAVS